MTTQKQTLLFVYNASTGLKNSVIDFAHKLFSPETYPCQLCKITYDSLSIKKEWKTFLSQISYKTQFLHKDEFLNEFPHQHIKLPCVLVKDENKFSVLITANKINEMNLQELMKTIQEKEN